MRFALAHAEEASLHDLEAVSLQVREEEEQPILRGRQGIVRTNSPFLALLAMAGSSAARKISLLPWREMRRGSAYRLGSRESVG
jgi:hypothetical protein